MLSFLGVAGVLIINSVQTCVVFDEGMFVCMYELLMICEQTAKAFVLFEC